MPLNTNPTRRSIYFVARTIGLSPNDARIIRDWHPNKAMNHLKGKLMYYDNR